VGHPYAPPTFHFVPKTGLMIGSGRYLSKVMISLRRLSAPDFGAGHNYVIVEIQKILD
jgi:hypothetical protein